MEGKIIPQQVDPAELSEKEQNPLFSSVWSKLLYGLVTILLPIFSFGMANFYFFGPEWQSGRTSVYAHLMLQGKITRYFLIFLIYSMLSMALLLIDAQRFARFFVVRFGIYTGVILAFHYTILLFLTEYFVVVFCSSAIFLYILLLSRGFGSEFEIWMHSKDFRILLSIVEFSLLAWMIISWESAQGILGLLLTMLVFPAGPMICLVLAISLSVKLLKQYEFPAAFGWWKALGVLVWGGGYAAAWRFSVIRMLDLYAALPPSPPHYDCFIATAAANGHPKFVGSQLVVLEKDKTLTVNTQVRVLKCGELALKAISPSAHRLCRKIYDRWGRVLAKKINNPYLADLAYLSLKPFEWGVRVVLKVLVPDFLVPTLL